MADLEHISVPGYALETQLGEGGMGVVFLAQPADGGDKVAVKVIRPWLLDDDAARAKARFVREATLGVRITNEQVHPNLLPIYSFGTAPYVDSEVLYLVMKYCPAGDLRSYIPNLRGGDVPALLDAFSTCADALSALHKFGTLHRDVKPVNVLVEETETGPKYYISDYGLAKSTFDKTLTKSREIVGDLRYMSPEHLRGARFVTAQSDLFSLGVLMYEVLTGTRPFEADDPEALRQQIRELHPERPSNRKPSLVPSWDTICLGLLAKDPAHRYKTASDVVSDLGRLRALQAPIGPGYQARRAQMFGIGDIVLRVAVHVGGDGRQTYRHEDGFDCAHTDSRYQLPADVAAATEELIAKRIEKARISQSLFEDRDQVRIDDYGHGVTDDADESPHPLRLFTSVTHYFATQRSNAALSTRLPDGRTMREVYATDSDDYRNSQLSNPICVNLSIVTKDHYVCAVRRGKRVGINPKIWAPAVSGTGNPAEDCPKGAYDPFRAAIREAKQEIFGSLDLRPEHITFFGVARTLGNFFPFLFGEVRHPYDLKHLLSLQPADRYEVEEIVARPFEIEDVTEWVREMFFETDSEGRRTATSHTTIFSLLQSLLYEYNRTDDYERIIDLLRVDGG